MNYENPQRNIFVMNPLTRKLFMITCLIYFTFASRVSAKVPAVVLAQKNSVVTVYVYNSGIKIGSASGFVADPLGIVVTNDHVVSEASEQTQFMVKFNDGRLIKADKIIGRDSDHDLALLKVKKNSLSNVKIAMDGGIAQGDDVIVIGSPLGLDLTISTGIVSSIRGADNLIQITAPISRGSSGSPVFNLKGEVVGIATMLVDGGQNLNFAIPVSHLLSLLSSSRTDYGIIKSMLINDNKEMHHLPDITINAQIIEMQKQAISEPNNSYQWYELGKLYTINNQYKEASQAFEIALKTDSDNMDILTERGIALYKMGQIDKARKSFERVLIAVPDNLPSLYHLGLIYIKIKSKKREALELWNRYLVLDKDSLTAVDITSRMR